MDLKILHLITTVLTSLISGFFYAYSCSVNPGLGRLKDAEYIRAMQAINRAVLNPVFFTSFFGALIMLPVSTWIWYRTEGISTGFYLLLAAAIIYFLGVFLVTGVGNVPLNESLDKFNLGAASLQQIKERRKAFEIPWNRFNGIRTIANLIALILLLSAIYCYKKGV